MIRPLDLPSAAGLEFGNKDVRHFTEGDAADVPGLSNPTRYLAERDNVVAAKLNETIETVNNQEQVITLTVPRTVVLAASEEIVNNWRIPAGYEARVLNATVASVPVSSDVELNVYFAAGFGNNTGDVVVTTASESQPQTNFKQNGELIISVKNKGATNLDMIASILLAFRPIGGKGGLLVGTVIEGRPGPPGQGGPKGGQGDPGTGGAGSPGLVWQRAWAAGRNYAPPQAVSFTSFGTLVSSYVCNNSHFSDTTNQPPNTSFWDILAQGSSGSVFGAPGPPGTPGTSGLGSTVCAFSAINGTLTTGTDWVGEAIADYPSASMAANTVYPDRLLHEAVVKSTGGTLAWLFGSFRMAFLGSGTITLPAVAYGAVANYVNSTIQVTAASQGTQPVEHAGTYVPVDQVRHITCVPTGVNQYVVKVLAHSPTRVAINVYGVQQV